MRYLSVTDIAKKWDVSERSVRNYCAQGRVNGAFLTGKTWNIPENAEKPERTNKRKEEPITLLDILKEQKASKYSGGIYHKTQIDLTARVRNPTKVQIAVIRKAIQSPPNSLQNPPQANPVQIATT